MSKAAKQQPKAETPPSHEDDPILDLAEAARQLGKHPRTVARWIQEGALPAIQLPSRLLKVRQSVLNRFLENSALPALMERKNDG